MQHAGTAGLKDDSATVALPVLSGPGSERRESCDPRGLIEKVSACNLPIRALVRSLPDNQLHQVHLPDHIVEGADAGV
jgi:hypothetical protein